MQCMQNAILFYQFRPSVQSVYKPNARIVTLFDDPVVDHSSFWAPSRRYKILMGTQLAGTLNIRGRKICNFAAYFVNGTGWGEWVVA